MSTDVQICNMALSHIGISSILSFTENSKAARECSRLYAVNRDSVLEDHKWGFATKDVTLSLLANEEPLGWTYAYTYPPDCAKAREIYRGALSSPSATADPGSVPKIDFEVRGTNDLTGRLIATNEESASLIYTGKVTSTVLFSAKFVTALSAKLASVLAFPLRADRAIATEWANAYVRLLLVAESKDSNEGYQKPNEQSTFLGARA